METYHCWLFICLKQHRYKMYIYRYILRFPFIAYKIYMYCRTEDTKQPFINTVKDSVLSYSNVFNLMGGKTVMELSVKICMQG